MYYVRQFQFQFGRSTFSATQVPVQRPFAMFMGYEHSALLDNRQLTVQTTSHKGLDTR